MALLWVVVALVAAVTTLAGEPCTEATNHSVLSKGLAAVVQVSAVVASAVSAVVVAVSVAMAACTNFACERLVLMLALALALVWVLATPAAGAWR